MARKKDIGKDQILDAAETLLQTRGFDGFGMRDLGRELGVSTASLHHHFPTKGELAAAATRRYRERFNKRLAEIEAELDDWPRRRARIQRAFARVGSESGKACLLGMMASDFQTLPAAAKEEALLLLSNFLGWLTRFTVAARRDNQLSEDETPEETARVFLAQLQGELMLARMK